MDERTKSINSLIIDSDAIINLFFGTENARKDIKTIIKDSENVFITTYTIGELKRVILSTLINIHYTIQNWIIKEKWEDFNKKLLIQRSRDIFLKLYGGSERKTLRLKEFYMSIFLDFLSDTFDLPIRDSRTVFLKRLENYIENFDVLFINDDFEKRNSSMNCNWLNYKIQIENKELKFYKKGFGCLKLKCNTLNEILKYFTSNKERLLKVYKIKNFKPIPNWYPNFKMLFNLFLNKMLDKSYKRLSYKCKSLGDLILIIDTNENETILTSNNRDFQATTHILGINLIIFKR